MSCVKSNQQKFVNNKRQKYIRCIKQLRSFQIIFQILQKRLLKLLLNISLNNRLKLFKLQLQFLQLPILVLQTTLAHSNSSTAIQQLNEPTFHPILPIHLPIKQRMVLLEPFEIDLLMDFRLYGGHGCQHGQPRGSGEGAEAGAERRSGTRGKERRLEVKQSVLACGN
jgi:hypothetical protein